MKGRVSITLMVGAAALLSAHAASAREVPSCSYTISAANILQLANGALPEGATEDSAGDCVMQLQKTALDDEIALTTCPSHFQIRAENKSAFNLLVNLPVQKADSEYGKKYAEGRDKLRKSFSLAGCDKRVETYFSFSKDNSTFIERVQ